MLNKLITITTAGFMAMVFFTIFMNLVFYPECNRQSRECFLLQHAWTEHAMTLASKGGE